MAYPIGIVDRSPPDNGFAPASMMSLLFPAFPIPGLTALILLMLGFPK